MRLTPRLAAPRGGVGRLAIQVGIAFALAMAAVGMIAFSAADAWVSSRIDASLRHHTAKYLAPLDGHLVTDVELVERIGDWQRRKVLSERTYLLFDRQGRRLAGRLDLAPPAPGLSDVRFYGGGRASQTGRALATRTPDGSLLVIVQHSEAAENLHALLPSVVLLISLVAVIMGVTATLLFARLTANRLLETQSAADAIAAGDLSRRIPTDRLDGMFAVQAHSLNRMLDRMEELVSAQQLFSSNLAHELRTPLTRLRTLLAQGDSGRPVPLERAERECAAIIAIFDALLRLAEIETGRLPRVMAPLSLRPLLEDVADTMEPVLADHGGRLEVGRLDDVTITGDADLLNQLLVNLLENVATHTPAGTSARLSLERDEAGALITIRDDGPGLGPGDHHRLLRPFERGAAAGDVRGSGLGLAIAQAIVRFHRGRLDLGDAAPGLEVRVQIPANDPLSAVVPAGPAAA
ncbi:sensor histidine kinase [Sphingomonas azotifigens]|uniref:sensor histidine kinase n=1 Tax=Sphingomonas azotifigens TaxID=330920 RepID=UPI000A035144|nr:HAMP domain-containing sensor histidine kinase [Sphingomonas azotifigens]